MDTSKIASWGSLEDRPEREQMRALLIGRDFMAEYRAAEGGKKESRHGWWFKWISEETAAELLWMWSSDRAFKTEHTQAYAQVAGDLILRGAGQGGVLHGLVVQDRHQRGLRLVVRAGLSAA